jgi:transcriptional regulator with XRE-family HTH domain
MGSVETGRARLARLVEEARVAKGLSVREAARLAGVNRATWTAVEDSDRVPQSPKAALMEPVIDWGPRSFDAVVAGGEPTLLHGTGPSEEMPGEESASGGTETIDREIRRHLAPFRRRYGREKFLSVAIEVYGLSDDEAQRLSQEDEADSA